MLGFVETAQTGNVMTLQVHLLVANKYRLLVTFRDVNKISSIYKKEKLIGLKVDKQDCLLNGVITSFEVLQ